MLPVLSGRGRHSADGWSSAGNGHGSAGRLRPGLGADCWQVRRAWRRYSAVTGAAAVAPRRPSASRVLFRVFLSDGRVLSSYGEWARLDDRVIFSMPTQLSRDPVELHLITIPSQRVDWPRTEMYAESVRAAAYAAHRGDADFAVFTSEVAKTLNEVAEDLESARAARHGRTGPAEARRLAGRALRLSRRRSARSAERARRGDRATARGRRHHAVRSVLSAPLPAPPPPPLPPPSDAELVEQFVAAASISESPAERLSLLQTVLRLLDRAVGTAAA